VEHLCIPEQDNQADMIVFFSLFPHLSRRECFIYLKEAARVVLPGGRIVVSFLDSSLVDHRLAAGHWVNQIMHRLLGNRVKLTLLNQIEMQAWGDHLNLELNFIGTEAIGQNVCVYRKNEII
jgi:predicted SAM-dependent methyltransferase